MGWGGGGIDPCLVTSRPRALAGRLAPRDTVSGRGEGGMGREGERGDGGDRRGEPQR